MRGTSIEAFPAGRWWIRWIDHVLIVAGSPDPLIHVVLSPFREGLELVAEHLRAIENDVVVAVSCGLIPKLAIGDVYRDGSAERDPRVRNRIRSVFPYELDAVVNPYSGGMRAVEDAFYGFGRDGVCLGDPGPVLSVETYPGLVTRRSACVWVYRKDKLRVVIPVIEVLRSFMAPHGAIVRALLSSEWDDAVRRLVDLEAGAGDADASLHLREGVPAWCATYIANMLAPRSELGLIAARRVHSGLLVPDPALMDAVDEPRVPRGACTLSTTLPFEEEAVTLRLLGFDIDRDTFFAAKVVGGVWPDARPLAVTYPEGSSEIVSRSSDLSPPGRVALARRAGRGRLASSRALPAEGRTVGIAAESVAWQGLPELSVTARPVRALSEVAATVRFTEPTSEVKVSLAPITRSGMGRAAHVVRRPAPEACAIFDRATAILRDLEGRGVVWDVHVVPAATKGDRRGEHDVWRLGTRLGRTTVWADPWEAIVPGEDHPRTILVLAARVALFGSIRWFEVERRATDGRETESYRALIAGFGHSPSTGEVATLVGRLASARGVVRDLGTFVEGTAAIGAATFKHSTAAGGFRQATVMARFGAALTAIGSRPPAPTPAG